MNTYLAIITTVLVLTQIVRVTQNAIGLSRHEQISKDNTEILKTWQRIDENTENLYKFLTSRWD